MMPISPISRATWLTSAILLALACGPSPVRAAADGQSAILVGGSALIPMRHVFQWLGATVTYAGGRITATRGRDVVKLGVGSRQASVNARPVTLSKPPSVRGGTTYVPLRFVAESMGAGVRYESAARRVVVTDGSRSLIIPIAERDPVKMAIAVFRQYIATVKNGVIKYDSGWAKTAVFINPDDYGWLKHGLTEPGMRDHRRPMMDDTKWPLRNTRFRQLLRSLGWSEGDPWLLYEVKYPAAGRMEVTFEEWNWGTSVYLRKSAGTWTPTRVQANGEGNEGSPPLTWAVTGSGSTFGFRKVR